MHPATGTMVRCFLDCEEDTIHWEPRFTSLFDLWITGVGAVIAGDFFGWTPVLQSGLGTAFLLVAGAGSLYAALGMSIAELAVVPNAPEGAAAHQFVAPYLGRRAALACALGEAIKTVFATAAIVASIAAYAAESVGWPLWSQQVLWVVVVAAIGAVAARGEASHAMQIGSTALSLCVMAVFYASAVFVGNFGESEANDFKSKGLLESAPYALWFFLGIEGLPLAAPSTSDPTRLIPEALVLTIATICLCSGLTLVAAASLVDDINDLVQDSSHPLLTSFRRGWGRHNPANTAVAFLVVAGLVASLNAFFFYTSELFKQLKHDFAPSSAILVDLRLVAFTVLASLFLLLILHHGSVGHVANSLVFVSIAGATVAYAAQLVAFLAMRRRHQFLEMFHWRSPVGIPGAICALVLDAAVFTCLVVAAALYPMYRPPAGAVATIGLIAAFAAALSKEGRPDRSDPLLTSEGLTAWYNKG